MYQIQNFMSSNNNDIDNVSVANETRFCEARCTCIAMGVLSIKLIMSSNVKKIRVEVCCHGNKLFTAKSHTMHYYCPKRHMYKLSNMEALRVSPCCQGN